MFVAGIIGALAGGQPAGRALEHRARAGRRPSHPQHSSTTYRYCTSFAVTGTDLEPRRFAPALERLGDSVLIVGDQATLKVHVHTDDPDAVTAVFAPHGAVSHLDVADMRAQVEQREERVPAARARRLRRDRGRERGRECARCSRASACARSTGARRSRPRAYDVLAAIHAIPAEQVVVLPNSPNALDGRPARRPAVGQGGMRWCRRSRPRPDWRPPSALDPTRNAEPERGSR